MDRDVTVGPVGRIWLYASEISDVKPLIYIWCTCMCLEQESISHSVHLSNDLSNHILSMSCLPQAKYVSFWL
jgi:hypothetical protein